MAERGPLCAEGREVLHHSFARLEDAGDGRSNVVEVDAGRWTVNMVHHTDRSMCCLSIGTGPGRVWIINETHLLTARVIGEFLTLLERLPTRETHRRTG